MSFRDTVAGVLVSLFVSAAVLAELPKIPDDVTIIEGIPDGYEVILLSNDEGIKARPDINDSGQVCWSSSFTVQRANVFFFDGEIIWQVAKDDQFDVDCAINDHGDKVWMTAPTAKGPYDLVVEIDGVQTAVTEPLDINDDPFINNNGTVVYGDDLSGDVRHVELRTYHDGVITPITNGGLSNQLGVCPSNSA